MPFSPQRAIPPLDWLRSFEAAARLTNFTAAAAELGLTQAAVSQHIRLLEQRLETQLFTRLARGVGLTPAGAAYLPHIQSAFATIGNSTSELFEPRAVESVVIRSPISFAMLMLAPLIGRLSADLPMVRLHIETIHKPVDYGEAWNGLDIRFGNGSFAGRLSDRLTWETLAPMAAPALAAGPEWTRLPLLSVVGAREMWSEWFAAAGMTPVTGRTHAFDTFATALEAAKNGAGILLGSRPLVDAAVAAGALAPVSAFALDSGAGHFLTAPSGAMLARPAQAVRDWLVTAVTQSATAGPDHR